MVSVYAGFRYTSAIDAHGNIWAWGNVTFWSEEWLENIDKDLIEINYEDMFFGRREMILSPVIVMKNGGDI